MHVRKYDLIKDVTVNYTCTFHVQPHDSVMFFTSIPVKHVYIDVIFLLILPPKTNSKVT